MKRECERGQKLEQVIVMSKHSPSKRMKDKEEDKVEVQEEEANLKEKEEEALLEEEEEEREKLKK